MFSSLEGAREYSRHRLVVVAGEVRPLPHADFHSLPPGGSSNGFALSPGLCDLRLVAHHLGILGLF